MMKTWMVCKKKKKKNFDMKKLTQCMVVHICQCGEYPYAHWFFAQISGKFLGHPTALQKGEHSIKFLHLVVKECRPNLYFYLLTILALKK